MDSLIAAECRAHWLPLYTCNPRDFLGFDAPATRRYPNRVIRRWSHLCDWTNFALHSARPDERRRDTSIKAAASQVLLKPDTTYDEPSQWLAPHPTSGLALIRAPRKEPGHVRDGEAYAVQIVQRRQTGNVARKSKSAEDDHGIDLDHTVPIPRAGPIQLNPEERRQTARQPSDAVTVSRGDDKQTAPTSRSVSHRRR
jgi:hypothetical protein